MHTPFIKWPGWQSELLATCSCLCAQLVPQLALLFDRVLKQAPCLCCTAVTRFARATGDVAALSTVDIRLLALAHTLEVSAHGGDHLATHPNQVWAAWPSHSTRLSAVQQTDLLEQRCQASGLPSRSNNGTADSTVRLLLVTIPACVPAARAAFFWLHSC